MKLEFKYTNDLVSYLLNIEKYKTALEYLYLPTRTKQKLMYDAKLKKTHFSTSIEGNVLSLKQVENVINQKNQILPYKLWRYTRRRLCRKVRLRRSFCVYRISAQRDFRGP